MKTATAVKLKSLTMGTVMGLLAPFVTGGEAIGLTTAGDPSDYLVNPGEGYDGVAELILGGSRCTGALLPTGAHILTAAHCLTGNSGNQNVFDGRVNFDLDTGNVSLSLSDIFIHPDWTNNLWAGNDIAILELENEAPEAAERFEIYRQTDEVGQVGDKVGYGRSGNGNDGRVLDPGTKRQGQNLYDATGELFERFGWGTSDNTLVYDFDNGLPENDAFGDSFGSDYADLGLGADEVNGAPADSGGPTFINGLIAGITSFGTRWSSDIDRIINASFGEFSFDTRVSSYADWIDNILDAWVGGGDAGGGDPGDVGGGGDPGDVVGGGDPGGEGPVSVPEPSTLAGLMVLGAGLLVTRKKRRSTQKISEA